MAKKRKSGDGSVYLRKDGRWEGRVVIGYDDKGYPKSKNVLAPTKEECLRKLNELKKTTVGVKTDSFKPDMRFGDWLDYWYQNCCKPRLRETTQVNYETAIYAYTIPVLGEIPLNKLTQNDLQQFYNYLKTDGRKLRRDIYGAGLSDRTVRGCHANCKAALQKAVEEGLLQSNPAAECKLPPKKARKMEILSREELQRLLIQAKEEGCYELLLLEVATGLRIGELLALQWENIDLETGELRIEKQVNRPRKRLEVTEPKTSASIRTIVLPCEMLEVLREYRTENASPWLFPSPVKENAPCDPASCRKKLKRLLERADCKRVRFHDLRHTFATLSLESGMDVKTLSTVLGHVSAATTLDIYTHITDDMQRVAAEKINRGICKSEENEATQSGKKKEETVFEPYRGKRRKAGTGCITRINENLWEGRYSPRINGKRMARNVYAHSEEACEEKLQQLIAEMKAEIAAKKNAPSKAQRKRKEKK